MVFQIGDQVREGTHIGIVTAAGTVLIQVRTTKGTCRVVCPWELVPLPVPPTALSASLAPSRSLAR